MAVAESSAQRQQGLRRVESLPPRLDGMLFVFDNARPVTFGMRDTIIPLDIWWFDEAGALIGTTEMTPCPEEPCAGYASPEPIRWALETPAGQYEFPVGAMLSTGDSP